MQTSLISEGSKHETSRFTRRGSEDRNWKSRIERVDERVGRKQIQIERGGRSADNERRGNRAVAGTERMPMMDNKGKLPVAKKLALSIPTSKPPRLQFNGHG